ncbi:CBS domain-containing protein [Parasulfuritortus cantonensis]|uniref:Magnesium and cobalt efflux protein CorC n=1 Tax=Parasulfuritortus cantonensis TaxID=2528202 RepID=A0A4V2NVB9_9PROT|nr:transporter associated domain-containing protein [Parasulfuritortus cantonensis]TCJ12876.1 CBS domain-containing protein [Parasulfuritortus cantonensis]
MSDDSNPRPSLIERITAWLSPEPDNREELLDLLHAAYDKNLLDADALSMIEGVMQVSEMQVREIMLPRAQMDVVDVNDPHDDILRFVLETAHSRFPAVDGDRDNVVGILLAKDLLRLYAEEDVNLREMLRPAVFVPESKRLNILLREFRSSRNHIAIVVDEYGGAAGLVTIEDVLEQIVGDIEDEYDYDEDEDNILQETDHSWRVKAQTEIADFNEIVGADFPDDEFDTVGGLVVNAFGRMPKRGECVDTGGFHFRVTRADSRRLHTVVVQRQALPEAA